MRHGIERLVLALVLPARPTFLVLIGLLVVLLTPAPTSAATELFLDSEPGDSVGGGIQQTFTEADGAFTGSRNFDNGVSIDFNGPGHFWGLDFAAPNQADLIPGPYEDATRFPFQSPAGAGLSVSGDGRGCNTLTGRFDVLEAVYGPGGEVERFAAEFEQHCEGGDPALFGRILFNSTGPPFPPPSVYPLRASLSCSPIPR